MHSSMNDQSTKKVKCDFTFFFIINGLTAIDYGSTSLCCGNAELIRVSLIKRPDFKVIMHLINTCSQPYSTNYGL